MAGNFFGITDKGKMRDNNEDTFIAQTITHNHNILACVIDGVGGYEGGEIASALANEAIAGYLQQPFDNSIQALQDAVVSANKNIYSRKLKDAETSEMACVLTLVLANVEENKFYYAHVGDTRLYLLRDQSLVKVTSDHSFVGFLEDSGRLTEEAAMSHPKRNEINKALGFNEQQFALPGYIETGESPFLPGDILLLCSDGLSDMINNKIITSILTSPKNVQAKAKALIDAANDAGGKDNITVVLVENDKLPQTLEATRPVIIQKNNAEDTLEKITLPANNIMPSTVDDGKADQSSSPVFFICVFIVLLATLSWFIYKDYFKNETRLQPKAIMLPQKTINTEEQKLKDNIIKQKDVFLLQLINVQPLIFNDSVFVNRDSVHIHGGGSVINADTIYHGAAFIFSANCKYILIDSLTLQNFNIGIIINNNALHLKDVQFKYCNVAVRREMYADSKTVNAKFSDSLSFKKDSVKAKN